jgi:signal transduction histidine kinase
LDGNNINIKHILFSKINRKITFLFIIVGLLAPTIAIYYFYSVTLSSLPETITTEQSNLFRTVAITIIALIAVNAGFIGFFVSRSISRPIKELYKSTLELEKGNYDVEVNIKTGDEIERLGNAFNNTTMALAKLNEERKEIDSAKTEFLSITSHELRTPITPMKAQLQMLEKGYLGKLTDKQKESLGIIIRNTDRLDNIIVDFLEISRIEAARLKFNFRETDLAETVRETVKFMEGFAREKDITLIVETDELPTIEADPDRVNQVLRNLITNAIKFSENGSKIEISAKLNQNYILFDVRDYGTGITPEDQIRIFEPFYQVEKHSKRRFGGTGLGLAICRGIVESQNGKLWVESKVGIGSKFYFTMPLEPIRDIKPIKVLFSQKATIEKKLKEEFQTMLGPLGENEFNELKTKNAIGKEDLFEYIDLLTEQFIITSEDGIDFKNRISGIFGEEKELNKVVDTNYEVEEVLTRG